MNDSGSNREPTVRIRPPSRLALFVAAGLGALLVFGSVWTGHAEACGCVNPPVPQDASEEYAVNQQAEQIIFEVDDTTVTAHVLIRYEGSPASFAWILPVPTPPTNLGLSPELAFGMVDEETRPNVNVQRQSLCPDPRYVCEYGCRRNAAFGATGGVSDAGMAAAGGGALNGGSEVQVIDRQVVGSYSTVTFTSGDADAAIQWLQDEGFIVNDTMAPYMQPYADMGTAFVAAKLLPGSEADEIKPLRLTYEGDHPMVPLRLTAIAAEPELTVTSYIYGEQPYQPMDRPIVDIREEWISQSPDGRTNYPHVLSRAVDDAGGDGFAIEYAGDPVQPSPGEDSRCCTRGTDICGVQDDGECQCPDSEFDQQDCEGSDVQEALDFVDTLAGEHASLTRISTRMGPHEMTFDPTYEPMSGEPPVDGRLTLNGERKSLARCEGDILDSERYETIEASQQCASVYCGHGECVITEDGNAGCACDPDYVARQFTNLDGRQSVICVPNEETVQFDATGIELKSACTEAACAESGSCVDIGGFPTCRCDPNHGAVVSEGSRAPSCEPVAQGTGSPGARNFSDELEELRVCAPAPPEDCGPNGWLVRNENIEREGVICESSLIDDPARLQKPEDAGVCETPPTSTSSSEGSTATAEADAAIAADAGVASEGKPKGGGGCRAAPGRTNGGLAVALMALATVLATRRRRRSR